ncbi:MAG: hypothetical protein VB858_14985 [Planctomycetaceae bacterium]
MLPLLTGEDSLRRLFAALTEHTFQVDLGVADPALSDYLVDMLIRFTRTPNIYPHRDAEGQRLEEVADMLVEANQREARPKRELRRHIGDFTLFWSGVYPEALPRLKSVNRKDFFISYDDAGRESYFIASTFQEEPFEEEAAVLRRLSSDFELCKRGLNRIRRELDQLPTATARRIAESG